MSSMEPKGWKGHIACPAPVINALPGQMNCDICNNGLTHRSQTKYGLQMCLLCMTKISVSGEERWLPYCEDSLMILNDTDVAQKAKVNRDTLVTKTDLAEHKRVWQEEVARQESRTRNLEERVFRLEQDRRSSSSVDLSDETVRKLSATAQQVGVHDIRLAEMDIRFQCLEAANYDGVLIWKVMDYARRKQDAYNGRSQPFYTSRYGYKMCGCLYMNMGRGTHLSLLFALMRGKFDALLEWPFRAKVTLSLLDQSPARRDLSDTFRPDPTSSSFRRPSIEMNIASGCPMFISHQELQNSRFLKDDTIFMKIIVDITDLMPR